MKRNLTLKQTATILETSVRTVYRLISDGELVAFKVRGSKRITEESLESYRERQINKYISENGINRDRM
jgi:excisionase family DNA binding protein